MPQVAYWGSLWHPEIIGESEFLLIRSICGAFARVVKPAASFAEYHCLRHAVDSYKEKGSYVVRTSTDGLDIDVVFKTPSILKSFFILRRPAPISDPTGISSLRIFYEEEVLTHFYYSATTFENIYFYDNIEICECVFANCDLVVTFRHIWNVPLTDPEANIHFGKKGFQIILTCDQTVSPDIVFQFAELITPRHFGTYERDPFESNAFERINDTHHNAPEKTGHGK